MQEDLPVDVGMTSHDDDALISLTTMAFAREPTRLERGADAMWECFNPAVTARIRERTATWEEFDHYREEQPRYVGALVRALAVMQEEPPEAGTCPVCGKDDIPIEVYEDARPLLDSHPKPGMESASCTTFAEAMARSCEGSGRVAVMVPHCPQCGGGLPGWYWPMGDPWRSR